MANGTNAARGAETTSETGAVVDYGKEALLGVEAMMFGAGRWAWGTLHGRPYLGAVVGGGLCFGAAVLLGVAELAVTAAAAYTGYRMLAYNESLVEALEKMILARQGELLDEIEKEEKEREQQGQETQVTENKVDQSTVAAAERSGNQPARRSPRKRKTS
jgi:hypothetical protein